MLRQVCVRHGISKQINNAIQTTKNSRWKITLASNSTTFTQSTWFRWKQLSSVNVKDLPDVAYLTEVSQIRNREEGTTAGTFCKASEKTHAISHFDRHSTIRQSINKFVSRLSLGDACTDSLRKHIHAVGTYNLLHVVYFSLRWM